MSTHQDLPSPEDAKAALDTAQATYTAVMADLRTRCTHPTILRVAARDGMFGYQPERRICYVCGTEEEQRSGWHILPGNARTVTRAELHYARKDGTHLFRWCSGNRHHSPHPHEGALGYSHGSRCCPEHVDEAEAAIWTGGPET